MNPCLTTNPQQQQMSESPSLPDFQAYYEAREIIKENQRLIKLEQEEKQRQLTIDDQKNHIAQEIKKCFPSHNACRVRFTKPIQPEVLQWLKEESKGMVHTIKVAEGDHFNVYDLVWQ